MDKNLTEVVFILDRSGSMSGMERDTIGGFNSMLEKQREGEGRVLVSTVLFDHETEVLHDRVDIREVQAITDKQYYVRGATALLDAIGGAIHHMGMVHKYAREEDRPNKTLFVIITDGEENSSQKYSARKVKKMVERQKEQYGWEFIFLGANIDAIETAERFGIDANHSADYVCDEEGTALNFNIMGAVLHEARCAEKFADVDISQWTRKIRADHAKRMNGR